MEPVKKKHWIMIAAALSLAMVYIFFPYKPKEFHLEEIKKSDHESEHSSIMHALDSIDTLVQKQYERLQR